MIRWACRISEYNIVLSHRAGAKHTDADHMSRIPEGTAKSSVTAAITKFVNGQVGVKHNHQQRGNKIKEINLYSDEINLVDVYHKTSESEIPITYWKTKPAKWSKDETSLKSSNIKVMAMKTEEVKSKTGKKVNGARKQK